jgi:hypothetical protein
VSIHCKGKQHQHVKTCSPGWASVTASFIENAAPTAPTAAAVGVGRRRGSLNKGCSGSAFNDSASLCTDGVCVCERELES